MLLLKNIKRLAGIHAEGVSALRGQQLANLPAIEHAWLLIEDGLIKDFGPMETLPSMQAETEIDASGRMVLPCWCDSHTHIVFAASREEEFVMKIRGQSYEEIAKAGGGILNSARKLAEASEDELFESAAARLKDMISQGTGAVEIKSGYGLSTESELKMLRVIKRLKATFPVPVKATFLAAHAYPASYKNDHEGYIRLIIEEMLPAIAAEGLADYIDVFCEQGFFSVSETERILEAGSRYGLKPKIHANQLSISGAVEAGIRHKALSVDHLEETDAAVIDAVAGSDTIATLLPSCSFYLGIPFANAGSLINANAIVSLASDHNPGSTPSGNMNFVVSLGCIKLKMLPEEAINAATLNGAAAMELSQQTGSITRGKLANFILTKPVSSVAYLPYAFGTSSIDTVYINGKPYG